MRRSPTATGRCRSSSRLCCGETHLPQCARTRTHMHLHSCVCMRAETRGSAPRRAVAHQRAVLHHAACRAKRTVTWRVYSPVTRGRPRSAAQHAPTECIYNTASCVTKCACRMPRVPSQPSGSHGRPGGAGRGGAARAMAPHARFSAGAHGRCADAARVAAYLCHVGSSRTRQCARTTYGARRRSTRFSQRPSGAAWAHPCHICTGTRPDDAGHICAGTGAHPCHICAGTGPTPATSAPGPGSPLPTAASGLGPRLLSHLHRDRAWLCSWINGHFDQPGIEHEASLQARPSGPHGRTTQSTCGVCARVLACPRVMG
jgi:hypothetical protein